MPAEDIDWEPGRAVVVIDEVGPEHGTTGEAAGSAGAREVLTERPSGGCGKPWPQRRRRHALGHSVDHEKLGGRRRHDRVHHCLGELTGDTDRQQRYFQQ